MAARALLLAFVLLVGATARATVLQDWSLEERIARSDNVVSGTVKAQQARWDGDQIVTDTIIAVRRTIFGPERREIMLTQLGGTIGETTLDIAGSAQFDVGDEVLLIVKRDQRGFERLVGMSLGAFIVQGKRLRQHIDVPLMRGDGRLREPPGELVVDIERVRGAASEVRRTLERTAR